MALPVASVLPSIRTLPLTDEAQELFSRAVQIVQQRPGDFAPVAAWLEEHYSETALRELCRRQYRHDFKYRLCLLRQNSATYGRRLAVQQGRPLHELMRERIREAQLRGQRLEGKKVVCKARPVDTVIDETNVHLVCAWEDEQYRRRFRQIQGAMGNAERSEHDHPERPDWRLRRVVNELVAAEYPDGPEHLEHSRRIVAVAALLMPEPLPALGKLGDWPFASRLNLPEGPTGDRLVDTMAAGAAAASEGPHGYHPTTMDPRHVGREEVMFERMPPRARTVVSRFPLDGLLDMLRIAVDVLERDPAAMSSGHTAPRGGGRDIGGRGAAAEDAAKPKQEKWPNATAAAKVAGVTPSTITRAHKDGKLAGRREGNELLIDPAALVRWVRERQKGQDARLETSEGSPWLCLACERVQRAGTRPPTKCDDCPNTDPAKFRPWRAD